MDLADDPRYHDLRQEIDKLGSPTGAAVDWRRAAALADDLSRGPCPDLQVLAYAALARLKLDGPSRLGPALDALAAALAAPALTPRRPQSRARALEWLLARLLPDLQASAQAPDLHDLPAALRRLRGAARQALGDLSPSFRAVLQAADALAPEGGIPVPGDMSATRPPAPADMPPATSSVAPSSLRSDTSAPPPAARKPDPGDIFPATAPATPSSVLSHTSAAPPAVHSPAPADMTPTTAGATPSSISSDTSAAPARALPSAPTDMPPATSVRPPVSPTMRGVPAAAPALPPPASTGASAATAWAARPPVSADMPSPGEAAVPVSPESSPAPPDSAEARGPAGTRAGEQPGRAHGTRSAGRPPAPDAGGSDVACAAEPACTHPYEPAPTAPIDPARLDGFLAATGEALERTARLLRTASAVDPRAIRLLRVGLWLRIDALPPPRADGLTNVVGLEERDRALLEELSTTARWPALLARSEGLLGAHRLALDLQRHSAAALAGIGAASALAALHAELRALLTRLPGLPDLRDRAGRPLADPATARWLAAEVVPGAGLVASGDPDPEDSSFWRGLDAWLRGPARAGALAAARRSIAASPSGHVQWTRRLALAEACERAGNPLAPILFGALVDDLAPSCLERLDPELAARCLAGLARTCPDRTSAGPVLARLARLDPAAAAAVLAPGT